MSALVLHLESAARTRGIAVLILSTVVRRIVGASSDHVWLRVLPELVLGTEVGVTHFLSQFVHDFLLKESRNWSWSSLS